MSTALPTPEQDVDKKDVKKMDIIVQSYKGDINKLLEFGFEPDSKDSFIGLRKKILSQDSCLEFKKCGCLISVTNKNNGTFELCFKAKKNTKLKISKFEQDLNNFLPKYYFYDDKLLDTIVKNDQVWFNICEIALILKYSGGGSYLLKYYSKYNIQTINECYVSSSSLLEILNRSRKPEKESLMKQLHLTTLHMKQSLESSVLELIIDFLKEEKIEYIHQHKCGQYFIDLYIPKFKVVVEVDEDGHKNYNKQNEQLRENYIRANLTDKILRINPNEPKFRIAREISKLNKLINVH